MKVIELNTIDSTNNYAKEHINELEDKTIIHAIRQTCGKGRFDRKWIDLGEGNLFMTFVLKPSSKYCSGFANLTQYLSVVLCKILEEYGIQPQIKWPNDVLINGKKIAGILAQSITNGSEFRGIVLGIGVNLNANEEKLKLITDKVTTSLNIELKQTIDMFDFRNKLVEEFYKNYENFIQNGFEAIKTDYINRNCFLDKDLDVQVLNEIKSGFAKSLTDKGELVLLKDDKELVLTIGDIL